MLVGIVADTHGILREEVIAFLKGCDVIFHGGDVGEKDILEKLEKIAPVIVVRGNNDREKWAEELPIETLNSIGGKMIYMIHDLKQSKKVFDGSIDIVISGHSHIYKEEEKESTLYLNPGGAGPKRFGRPATAMVLIIEEDKMEVQKMTV